MQVITLTTDMGLQDHYVAALKGTILNQTKSVQLVDVSHLVPAFNVVYASYLLKNCFEDFPVGTIHIMAVDSEPLINFGSTDSGAFPSVMLFKGHYFISNDNGFFSLLLEQNKPEGFWRLDDVLSNPKNFIFPAKHILAPVACRIAKGEAVTEFATEQKEMKRAMMLNAVVETNLIKGGVIHIDHYGNIITNVSRDLFERFGKETPFTIFLRHKEYFIDRISNGYNEVVPGEKVAIFNANNLLEIALNRGANGQNGGASSLLGIRLNDIIRIEFQPRGSHQTLDSLF